MRVDGLVSDLCEEIDRNQDEIEYWKCKYEEINAKYSKLLDSSVSNAWRVSLGMVAIATHDKELAEAIT
jgi:hypothetical protein